MGGDEFAVFMLDSDNANANTNTAETIERLRVAVDSCNKQSKRGYDIEFSAGFVTVEPDAATTVTELLAFADQSIYAIKPASRRI